MELSGWADQVNVVVAVVVVVVVVVSFKLCDAPPSNVQQLHFAICRALKSILLTNTGRRVRVISARCYGVVLYVRVGNDGLGSGRAGKRWWRHERRVE